MFSLKNLARKGLRCHRISSLVLFLFFHKESCANSFAALAMNAIEIINDMHVVSK